MAKNTSLLIDMIAAPFLELTLHALAWWTIGETGFELCPFILGDAELSRRISHVIDPIFILYALPLACAGGYQLFHFVNGSSSLRAKVEISRLEALSLYTGELINWVAIFWPLFLLNSQRFSSLDLAVLGIGVLAFLIPFFIDAYHDWPSFSKGKL